MRGVTAILAGSQMGSATGTAIQQTATTTEGIVLLSSPRAMTWRYQLLTHAQHYPSFLATVSATASSTPKLADVIWAIAKLEPKIIHTTTRSLDWVGTTQRMLA